MNTVDQQQQHEPDEARPEWVPPVVEDYQSGPEAAAYAGSGGPLNLDR